MAAFYGVLTALYFALDVYSAAELPGKNALFGGGSDPARMLRVALAAAVSIAAAGGLAFLRESAKPPLQALSFAAALALGMVALAGYQRHYLADRISLPAALLVALPAVALPIWAGRCAERNVRLFTRANAWIDRRLRALASRGWLGRPWALWLLGAAGALVAAYFIAIALNQYGSIAPRYDTARFESTFWNTLRGRIAWDSPDGINYLGNHFTPSLALLLPVYAVFPHGTTLLALESLLLVAGAIPLWWLTLRVTGSRRAAYVFAVVYLCFPHVIGVNIQGFTEGCMIPLAGFGYLLLLEQPGFHRRAWFWLVLLVTIGIKEELAVTVAALSAAHWIQNRERIGHAAVIGVCAVWFLAVTQLVMPALLGPAGHPLYGKGWLYAFYFDDMLPDGVRTFSGYLANAALNPLLTAQTLARPHTLKFLLDISLPLLFLPWFGGLVLIGVIPNLVLVNLLTTYHRPSSTLSIYVTYLVPWFYAALYGWMRLRTRFPRAEFIGRNGLLHLLLLVSAVTLSQNVRPIQPITREQAELGAWLEARPAGLRIMASHCFVPLLAGRATVRTLDPREDLSQLDLVIVQSEQRYCLWLKEEYLPVRQAVLATTDFAEDLSPQPGIVVYRRVRPAAARTP
jgi:uncharacterized membrane protein